MENFEQKIMDLSERRKERLEKEEIPFVRRELEKVKEKTKELCGKDRESGFFHGAEILDVNIDELTDDDLFLYKDIKEFLRKKMPFDEIFKELSLHRLSIRQHVADIIAKNPNLDFRKDSRVAFSAWGTGRVMNEYAKRILKEKERKKKQKVT